MDEFTECALSALCPCGSGKLYKDCCKKKQFRWGYDEKGNLIQEKRMRKVVEKILKAEEKYFKKIFGRAPKPDEPVANFMPIYNDESLLTLLDFLRSAGVEEGKIYATYQCDGLIPSSVNEEMIADKDLAEYDHFYKEYKRLMRSKYKNGRINSVKFVIRTNEAIKIIITNCINILRQGFNDYVRRINKNSVSLNMMEEGSLGEYEVLSAIKTVKTLSSIEVLIENRQTESIYALSRSLFENYLYLNAILRKPDIVSDRRLRHKGLPMKELKKYSQLPADRELYKKFYAKACEYIHVDIASAHGYFHIYKPYDELNPSVIAALIATTLCMMIMKQMSLLKVDSLHEKDIAYMLKKHIYKPLTDAFILAQFDKEQDKDLLSLFVQRIYVDQTL